MHISDMAMCALLSVKVTRCSRRQAKGSRNYAKTQMKCRGDPFGRPLGCGATVDLLPGPESKIFEAIDSLLVAVSSISMCYFLVSRILFKNIHGTLLLVFPFLFGQSL